jgi:hypothetical protein
MAALVSFWAVNVQADTLRDAAFRVAQSLRASHVNGQSAQAITYRLAWEEFPAGTNDPRFVRFILQVEADFQQTNIRFGKTVILADIAN